MKSEKEKEFAKTARYIQTMIMKIRLHNTVSCQKLAIKTNKLKRVLFRIYLHQIQK